MLVLEPNDHGVVVALLYGELVSPLVLNRGELSDGLAFLRIVGVIVSVVCESQTRVVEGSLLHNGK